MPGDQVVVDNERLSLSRERCIKAPLLSYTSTVTTAVPFNPMGVPCATSVFWISGSASSAVALFASMTNIVSGFLITNRMLKMFKTRDGGGQAGHK